MSFFSETIELMRDSVTSLAAIAARLRGVNCNYELGMVILG